MYTDDPEGHRLNLLPGVEELVAAYKERFVASCRAMFEYGLEKHTERLKELESFNGAIDDAKLQNRKLAADRIDEFMKYKTKVLLMIFYIRLYF